MKKGTLLLLFLTPILAFAQYPPAAGLPGSTAMYKDSSVFTAWAIGCKIVRGFQDMSNPSLGKASVGDSVMATGIAGANGVVSLGDGGTATLTFDKLIENGPGFDFAVFENGFADEFLELAFVEVSSNGIDFFRFPSISLTQTSTQVGPFDSLETTKLNNFAGKYRALYGTPFDLEELANTPGLDVNNISHVRIVDVVGSIDATYATTDSQGNKVNDPWPTGFPSSGFDLDAVGVIHAKPLSVVNLTVDKQISIYPNPIKSGESIHIKIESLNKVHVQITDVSGKQMYSEQSGISEVIVPSGILETGLYLLMVNTYNQQKVVKLVIE